MKRPLLLGHRGASKYVTENTLAAFDLALTHGCDGFEFDVRYSKDGRSVICHDPLFKRRRISACLFSDLSLPWAEHAISEYVGKAYLDIELKVSGDAAPILQLLHQAEKDSFVISSFAPEVLMAVNAIDGGLPLGLICENTRQLKLWSSLPVHCLMIHYKLVSATLIEGLHRAGKQVFVWTVNREHTMRRMGELGVDGVISDDTKLLVRTLKHE